MDGLADVGVDPPALLHRRDHRGEVVVGEDHVRGPLGHVGPRLPHGAADVRRPEGGGVVDPVAGHGHHMALLLPGLHDAHFVLRGHPGVDREPFHPLLQGLLGEEVQPRPVDGPVPGAEDIQVPGDGHGGVPVVPGDHHRPDPRPAAPGHRLPYLGPGRVHKAHQAHEGQVPFQLLRGHGPGRVPLLPLGHRQDPQGPVGHPGALVLDPAAVGAVQGPGPVGPQDAGALGQHPLRGPLHSDEDGPPGPAVAGGHPLPPGVEGSLSPAGVLPVQVPLVQAGLPGPAGDGGLGGVPGEGPLRPRPGVGAQGPQQEDPFLQGGDGRPERSGGHAVLGEGARLVRADHRGAAQGLHSGEALDDGVLLCHPPHPHGQDDGDNGGQALGDGRHRQGHRREEEGGDVPVLEKAHPEHQGAHPHAHQGEDLGDLLHLPLEGGLPLGVVQEKAGDLPHLRVHPRGGDHRPGPAYGDHRPRQDHVPPLG